MIELDLSVRHEGCWTATVNDEFRDVSGTILFSYAEGDNSATMVSFDVASASTADRLVAWLRDHAVVEECQLVDRSDGVAYVNLRTDYASSETQPLQNALRETRCFPVDSAQVYENREHCSLVAVDHEQLQTVHDRLREYGSVVVNAVTDHASDQLPSEMHGLNGLVDDLSPRQREVIARAVAAGYYDSPRRCTVAELAEEDDANMSTVSEHLRRGEAKVIQAIAPVIA